MTLKNVEIQTLNHALKAVNHVIRRAKYHDIYADDSSTGSQFDWYISLTGYTNGDKYFAYTFYRYNGVTKVEQSHNTEIDLHLLLRDSDIKIVQ